MKVKSVMAEFLNHLTYLGYKIHDEHDGTFLAKHKHYFSMIIQEKSTGIIIYSSLKGSRAAKADRPGLLECINTINAKSMVLRFYAGEKNDLMMDAWLPKYYNRVGFANFMDLFYRDVKILFSDEYGIGKYCR